MSQNNDNRKSLQINFRLIDVKQVQFAKICDQWIQGNHEISNQLQFTSDTDQRIVHCTATFEYKFHQMTTLILAVKTSFEFERESWSAMYDLAHDHWVLPMQLVQHFADITVGCARGILAMRTEEAGIPRQILPLVSPASVIKNNLAIPRTPKNQGPQTPPPGANA